MSAGPPVLWTGNAAGRLLASTERGRPVLAAGALAGWCTFLAGALVALSAAGAVLPGPPLGGWADVAQWVAARPGAEAAFGVLRVVALGLAWYLLAATVLAAASRLAGWAALVRAADVVTVPFVRDLVARAVGVSLAVTLAGGSPAVAAPPAPAGAGPTAPAGPPTLRRLPPPDQPAVAAEPPAARQPDASRLGAAEGSTTTRPPGPEGPAAPTDTATTPATPTWTIEPGQHFWAVAEAVLARAWGRPPADAATARYWRTLIDANRSLLRDPTNPDLLFPGQVLTLPPAPAS